MFYVQNAQYNQASIRLGGPKGFLRGAAVAIEQARPHDHRTSPSFTSDDEVQALKAFAELNGLVLDAKLIVPYMATHAMKSGSEHKVAHCIGENRVIKDLNVIAIATESLFDYLTDHLLSNYFFDDDIHLEGFYSSGEDFHIIISQPFIAGIHPHWKALKEGLEKQGLRQENPASLIPSFLISTSEIGDVCVNDLHENNVILGNNSALLHPIDAHFYFEDHNARLSALKILSLWPPECDRIL